MVAFYGLNFVVSCESSVSVHLESHVLGDRALLESVDEQLPCAFQAPFCRRRLPKPISNARKVQVRHDGLGIEKVRKRFAIGMYLGRRNPKVCWLAGILRATPI